MGLRKIALAGLAGLLIPAWYVAQQPASRTVVEGRVLDRTTGAPLADVTLHLHVIGRGSREGKIDSTGAFAFTTVEAGRYFLEATRPDYLAQGCCPANEEYGSDVREFTVTSGQTYQATIQMLQSATIS